MREPVALLNCKYCIRFWVCLKGLFGCTESLGKEKFSLEFSIYLLILLLLSGDAR